MELATANTIDNQVNDKAEELIRQYEQLYSDRSLFEVQWQEIAELVYPNDSRSFQGQTINRGEKRNTKQFDSTANTALTRFMSILDSLLTPHNQKWHTLRTDDPALNKSKDVQKYFDDVTRIMFRERYSDTSNFIEQNQNVYTSLGAYGTGALFIDNLWGKKGLRYKSISLGNLYFSENHQGIPDRIFRFYRMTARQALQKWGDKVPVLIREMAKTLPETRYDFLHCVGPRDDYDPNRKDFRGMPFYSYDISMTGHTMLAEGGYRTMPYAVSRYSQSLEEVYGRSPVMDVLPTIKTLNEEKKALLKQAHRIVDPVYLVHDDGILSNMSVKPGTIVPGGVSPDGRTLVHTLPTGNIQVGKEVMDDDRSDIKDALLVSLFQILVETPEMTATEVMERTKEKGILLAPTVGRQEIYLGRMIDRELDLLSRQGLLPIMPGLLKEAGANYKVRFESPLAKMRRAEEASGLMRMLETSLQISQSTQDPSIMFFYNFDEIMPDMAEINGLPAKWIKTIDEVNAQRQAQAQAQQTQNLIQAGPAAAAVLKATNGSK